MVLPATVVVADDEAPAREAVRRVLEGDGCTVLEAGDGEAALALVGNDAPPVDLVVTDLRMPRLGGLEVLGSLRQHRPDLPVVIVSGEVPSPQISRLLQELDTPLLYKPCEPNVLTTAVRRALEHMRARAVILRQQGAEARQKGARLRATSAVLIASAHALQDRFPWWGSDSAGIRAHRAQEKRGSGRSPSKAAEPELAYDGEYEDETYTVQVLPAGNVEATQRAVVLRVRFRGRTENFPEIIPRSFTEAYIHEVVHRLLAKHWGR